MSPFTVTSAFTHSIHRSDIRITLENVSSLPIDFLRLSFDDSTNAPAQQALADGDLSVFDTYETEYDLIHRPVFACDNRGGDNAVGPGRKVTLVVSCRGKVGWYVISPFTQLIADVAAQHKRDNTCIVCIHSPCTTGG